MKRYELKNLFEAIQRIGDVKAGIKFNYAISKNFKKLQSELQEYDEAIKKFYDYTDEEKVELEKYEKKEIEFDALPKELQDKVDGIVKEVNEFFNGEAEFDFHKVELDDMPNDLTVAQFNSLSSLIKEE